MKINVNNSKSNIFRHLKICGRKIIVVALQNNNWNILPYNIINYDTFNTKSSDGA